MRKVIVGLAAIGLLTLLASAQEPTKEPLNLDANKPVSVPTKVSLPESTVIRELPGSPPEAVPAVGSIPPVGTEPTTGVPKGSGDNLLLPITPILGPGPGGPGPIPSVPPPGMSNMPGPESVYRLTWTHAKGLCQFVDKGDENWVELDKVGAVAFRFQETRRNCDFIELHDQSRGLTVRMYQNAMFIRGLGFEDWFQYYSGQWSK